MKMSRKEMAEELLGQEASMDAVELMVEIFDNVIRLESALNNTRIKNLVMMKETVDEEKHY